MVWDFEILNEIGKRKRDFLWIKTETKEIASIDPSTLNHAMDPEKLMDALQNFEDTQGT